MSRSLALLRSAISAARTDWRYILCSVIVFNTIATLIYSHICSSYIHIQTTFSDSTSQHNFEFLKLVRAPNIICKRVNHTGSEEIPKIHDLATPLCALQLQLHCLSAKTIGVSRREILCTTFLHMGSLNFTDLPAWPGEAAGSVKCT